MELSFPTQSPISVASFNARPEPDSGRTSKVDTDVMVRATESRAQKPGTDDVNVELDRETLRNVLDKTIDLVSSIAHQRHLKYEVREEAGLMQVQVIDSKDGSVIRKIPADEIVSLIEYIHDMLNSRLDVKA